MENQNKQFDINILALQDGISKIQLDLKKAETALQQVTDDFFNIYDTKTEKGRLAVAYDYEHYGAFAERIKDI